MGSAGRASFDVQRLVVERERWAEEGDTKMDRGCSQKLLDAIPWLFLAP